MINIEKKTKNKALEKFLTVDKFLFTFGLIPYFEDPSILSVTVPKQNIITSP